MRKPAILFILFLFFIGYSFAQINIIPRPAEVKQPATAGQFVLNERTPIVLEGTGLDNAANFLNDYLQQVYGFRLAITNKPAPGGIHLNYEKIGYPIPGAYRMEVNKSKVYIAGDNEAGVFYGVQSLLQLLPVAASTTLKIPFVNIKDYPRFQYRGLHLDVGRHFFPVDFVKRYIDYIALHKMNFFHWHLTDDQGWRIEINKHPQLTQVGGFRNGTIIGRYPGKGNDNIRYGGFYTQEEVKDIVAYAARRYVEVIPEIEMPGHASAALTAYPFLGCTGGPYKVQETWGVFNDVFCAGNDSVFNFLQDVLDEVMPLFPSKYVHIGGDECPKESWKLCPKCQQRIRDHHLKDEHELQSYFIQRMERYINGKGKTIIGWDEILEGGLAPNAIVMSWRGEQGGIEAAKLNHDVIMTPVSHVYLDYSQTRHEDSVTIGGYTTVQKTYSYEPVPAELTADQAKHILGAQGNLWTEYIKNPGKVEYMIFPRKSALSEVLWSPKALRNWTDFERRLQVQFKRYERWGAHYSKAFFELNTSVQPAKDGDGILYALTSTSPTGAIHYTPAAASTQLIPYNAPIPVRTSGRIGATLLIEGKATGWTWQSFHINKATGKKISIATATAANRQGNGGAFGLINGVRADKGGISSEEWLGWQGPDMEAVIDLGNAQAVSSVAVHILDQRESWVYPPQYAEVFASADGKSWQSLGKSSEAAKEDNNTALITVPFATTTRYIKVIAKNHGVIPAGQPGAGSNAWLFVDEISVQ